MPGALHYTKDEEVGCVYLEPQVYLVNSYNNKVLMNSYLEFWIPVFGLDSCL